MNDARHRVAASLEESLAEELAEIREAGLYRTPRCVTGPQGAEIILDGRRVVDYSSNDSLGLANHTRLRAAACAAIERYGVGSAASRLITGTMQPHVELERKAAGFLGRERALVFSSGYQANIGAIPALTARGDVILSDELNHASLIDGIRLSRAECRIFRHNDVASLRTHLEEIPPETRVLVVVESLFSMEGDRAPIAEIAALKRIRPFLLYVDEAHAWGAIGPSGRGLVARAGCGRQVDIILGTLGKAFGASGAVMAASSGIIDLLVNRARSFIYSTAPMPAAAAAADSAIDLVREGRELRQGLRRNTARFRADVSRILGQAPPGEDHIVPILCPGVERVMETCASLLEKGIFCQGIRPPTVPVGKCRLRFSLSALHTDEHLERAAAALEEVLGEPKS